VNTVDDAASRSVESRGQRLAAALGVRDAGRVLRDFATYLPTQAIPAIAGIVALPILARKLFPTELGVLAIAQTLITFGWTLAGAWLAAAIIREYPGHLAEGRLGVFVRTLRRATLLSFAGLAAFYLVLAAGAEVSHAVRQTAIWVAVATAGLAVQNTAVSLFAASLRPRAYAAVEASARLGGIGLGIALVFLGYGARGYLIALGGSSLAIGAVGLWRAWPHTEPRSRVGGDLGEWIRYGYPASLAAIVTWGLAFLDRYLLAWLKDAGAVGVYTVGNALGDRMVMVPMFAFAAAAAPLLVTAYEHKGREEVERLLASYTRIVLLIALPCVAFVAAVGTDLVTLITGFRYYDYREAATVAPIVASGSLLYALAALANTGLVVAKRTTYLVLSSSLGLLVNVGANLLLIPAYGIRGAAIATPVGYGVYLAATYAWSRHYATWHFPFATALRAAVASGVGYAALKLLPLPPGDLGNLLSSAAIGLPVYVVVLAVLGEHRTHAVRA
jgi:O-antigen/teichoic acid export membrane protein